MASDNGVVKEGTKKRGSRNSRAAQYVVIGLVMAALWLVFVFLLSSGNKKTDNPQHDVADPGKVAVKAITAPGEVVTDEQRWLYKAGDDITNLKGRVHESEELNKTLKAQVDTLISETKLLKDEAKTKPAGSNVNAASSSLNIYPPGTPSHPGPRAPRFVAPPAPAGFEGANSLPASALPLVAKPPPPSIGIGRVSLEAAQAAGVSVGSRPGFAAKPGGSVQAGAVAQTGATTAKSERPEKNRQTGKTYLPIGFVKARLLGGIDAPTSGSGQSNPLPVFFHLADLAWLPNHFRANVRDCMITAAGYGDLSSERAYFRLEKLSCIRIDGQVLEQNVSGTVYGEDGKAGMRGRLVSKQGQMLANALLAGVVSGIGRGVVYQTSTTGVTALGTTVTQADSGKEFQSGIAQGVNGAMDRLAQYYIALADRTFPVIEIDAQREIDLGFTHGTTLDIPLPNEPDLADLRGALISRTER